MKAQTDEAAEHKHPLLTLEQADAGDPSDPRAQTGRDAALTSLEDATGKGDVSRICSLLTLLKQQFSEQSRKTWPANTSKRLWSSILGALKLAQNATQNLATEVQVAACEAVEALGQSCKACHEVERDAATHGEAIAVVLQTLVKALVDKDINVLLAGIKALVSLSGCRHCRCYYDKATQERLGANRAVETLALCVQAFISCYEQAEALPDSQLEKAGSVARAVQGLGETLRVLHFACLLHPVNTARLAAVDGFGLIKSCNAAAQVDFLVQEQGVMLLTELACQGVLAQQLLESITAARQAAEHQLKTKRCLEVVRASVWCLGRLASSSLLPHPSKGQPLLPQAWSTLSQDVLAVVVELLSSTSPQDDPLAKHCLDYIGVIATAAHLHVHSNTTDAAHGTSVSSNSESPKACSCAVADPVLLSLLTTAATAVLGVAQQALDVRIQAVVLRTLSALLAWPGLAVLGQHSAMDVMDLVLKVARLARKHAEVAALANASAQGGNGGSNGNQNGTGPATKDPFLVQMFCLNVLGHLVTATEGAAPASADGNQYYLEVLACLQCVLKYVSEATEKVSYEQTELDKYLSVGSCRYACHCFYIHDLTKGREVLSAVASSARVLQWCGPEGINSADRDGFTALHRLAAAGSAECLEVFVSLVGTELDYLKRNKAGFNALQLARASKHSDAADLISDATEAAAAAAQEALLQELEREAAASNPVPSGAKPRSSTNGQASKQRKKSDDDKPLKGPATSVPKEDEEARKLREELDRRKAEAEEEYERALEVRRQQLEAEANRRRQQEAEVLQRYENFGSSSAATAAVAAAATASVGQSEASEISVALESVEDGPSDATIVVAAQSPIKGSTPRDSSPAPVESSPRAPAEANSLLSSPILPTQSHAALEGHKGSDAFPIAAAALQFTNSSAATLSKDDPEFVPSSPSPSMMQRAMMRVASQDNLSNTNSGLLQSMQLPASAAALAAAGSRNNTVSATAGATNVTTDASATLLGRTAASPLISSELRSSSSASVGSLSSSMDTQGPSALSGTGNPPVLPSRDTLSAAGGDSHWYSVQGHPLSTPMNSEAAPLNSSSSLGHALGTNPVNPSVTAGAAAVAQEASDMLARMQLGDAQAGVVGDRNPATNSGMPRVPSHQQLQSINPLLTNPANPATGLAPNHPHAHSVTTSIQGPYPAVQNSGLLTPQNSAQVPGSGLPHDNSFPHAVKAPGASIQIPYSQLVNDAGGFQMQHAAVANIHSAESRPGTATQQLARSSSGVQHAAQPSSMLGMQQPVGAMTGQTSNLTLQQQSSSVTGQASDLDNALMQKLMEQQALQMLGMQLAGLTPENIQMLLDQGVRAEDIQAAMAQQLDKLSPSELQMLLQQQQQALQRQSDAQARSAVPQQMTAGTSQMHASAQANAQQQQQAQQQRQSVQQQQQQQQQQLLAMQQQQVAASHMQPQQAANQQMQRVLSQSQLPRALSGANLPASAPRPSDHPHPANQPPGHQRYNQQYNGMGSAATGGYNLPPTSSAATASGYNLPPTASTGTAGLAKTTSTAATEHSEDLNFGDPDGHETLVPWLGADRATADGGHAGPPSAVEEETMSQEQLAAAQLLLGAPAGTLDAATVEQLTAMLLGSQQAPRAPGPPSISGSSGPGSYLPSGGMNMVRPPSAGGPMPFAGGIAGLSPLGMANAGEGLLGTSPQEFMMRPDFGAQWAEAEALLAEMQLGPGATRHKSDHPSLDPARGNCRFLWLGNLNTRVSRAMLKSVFEQFGPLEDVVTFPGRMYAFINFWSCEDAARAAEALHDKDIHMLTGNRKLVIKFRTSKRALGKSSEAVAAGLTDSGADTGVETASSLATAGSAHPGAPNSSLQHQVSMGSATAYARASDSSEAPPGESDPSGTTPSSNTLGTRGEPIQQAAGGHYTHGMSGGDGGSTSGGGHYDDASGMGGGLGGIGGGGGGLNWSPSGQDLAGMGGSGDGDGDGGDDGDDIHNMMAPDVPEGKPSRHLWLGNIPLKPNKVAMEMLFSRFGPLDTVRVFPGKTFAFVNFVHAAHAIAAKAQLDGQPAPAVTGNKPLVIRFQKDISTVPANLGTGSGRMSRSSSATNLSALGAVGGTLGQPIGEEERQHEPAVNLSNRLNPNNIHFDRELANRYKRMSKLEKETLWAQDRAMSQLQQLQQLNSLGNPNALLNASSLAATARLLAGMQDPGLLPRAMSTGALDQIVNPAGAAAAHGSLLRVATHNNLLGMSGAAAAAPNANQLLLPQQQQQLANNLGNLSLLTSQGLDAMTAQVVATANAQQAQVLQQRLQQQQLQQQLQQLQQLQLQQQLGMSTQQLASLQSGLQTSSAGGLDAWTAQALAGLAGTGAGGAGPSAASMLQQSRLSGQDPNAAATIAAAVANAFADVNLKRQQQVALDVATQQANMLQQQQQLQQLQQPLQLQSMLQQPSMTKQIPPTFLCPITRQLMLDPVVAADGVTYDRSSISEWIRSHDVSPVTRQPLANKMLTPNYVLRNTIYSELCLPIPPQ